jgi:hypothetical protein
VPAARIFFIFSRQLPIIVTASQNHSAALQPDFESTEITPKTALKNLPLIVSRNWQKLPPRPGADFYRDQ